MYIANSNSLKRGTYVCGKTIGKYLEKKGIPLLSMQNDKMVFARTIKLQKAIDEMPLYLKILLKGGVING